MSGYKNSPKGMSNDGRTFSGKQGVMPYDYLLFDLGHVLVQLRELNFLKRFKPEWDERRIGRWWDNLACIRLFEAGRIDEHDFLKMAVHETEFQGSRDEFRALFAGWVLGVYPGAEALIDGIKDRVRIGVLSNTNPLHIDIIRGYSNLLDLFHDRFFSYELGLLKPDPRAYEHVLEKIGMPAGRVVFFDDNRANIAAAAAVGLQSIWVSGFDDLAQRLAHMTPGKAGGDSADVIYDRYNK